VFVAVIHRIHDREGFRAAGVASPAAGWQDGIALAVHVASRDHRIGICVWEGESVTAVRDMVEGAVGQFSDNEYYEIDVDTLVPQLTTINPNSKQPTPEGAQS
jgi:hypothetical protein